MKTPAGNSWEVCSRTPRTPAAAGISILSNPAVARSLDAAWLFADDTLQVQLAGLLVEVRSHFGGSRAGTPHHPLLFGYQLFQTLLALLQRQVPEVQSVRQI